MKDVKYLTKEYLQSLNISTIRTNKKITYLNIESAFDIETTSIKLSDDSKSAFMYIWMFGIGYGNEVFYGRTWQEFSDMCKLLKESLDLSDEKRLVVYVHNLGYEFQFMRKYLEWEKVFSIGERKPIKAVTVDGIEFRDSYILSGYSLEKTAENLVSHSVKKLTGNLDYSLIRTKDTELSQDEMDYCENDILVVNAYINEQIEQYKDISKIPMTNTGRVRQYVRDNCYYTSKSHKKTNKGKYQRYRQMMMDMTLHVNEYIQLKRAFMGGFTHANANYSGVLLEDVTSIDFTSSYPATMLSEQYPMSKGRKVQIKSLQELDEYCKHYCMVFDIKFTNIKSKISHENYLSESKCYILKGSEINNGRVYSAEELAITITNVDFDIMKQCYNWESIQITNAVRYHKGYLPKSIIESILKLYEDKTVLKGVEGKEVEYLLSKGMLNSVYGMCVTDVVKHEHTYSDEWGLQLVDIDEEINKYNNSKSRFLFYPWGVFVTAYSRRNLWTGIIALGDDYVYSDTDSIKLLNYENHKGYIEWYNNYVIQKLKDMCKHYELNENRLSPKTQNGVEKMLGVWDYEGTYSRFKTLGAKRYMSEKDGKIELTVAGLSKQNGINYMIEKSNNDVDKVFDMFNDNLYIPKDRTGKMTHTYVDEYQEYSIKDYLGNESFIQVESGVHLEPCEFTLSISEQYNTFLRNFVKGYVYQGVKYV